MQEKLRAYIALLAKWNKVYNLTAIRDDQAALTLHVHDSLAILPYLPTQAFSLLDVGTGAGLPAIPIAIARPDCSVDALDAVSKKVAFVRQAGIELSLPNLRAIHSRIEAHGHDAPYDLVVSRAYASLVDFVTTAGHAVKPGGKLIAMKSQIETDEDAATKNGVFIRLADIPLSVQNLDAKRRLVVLERRA